MSTECVGYRDPLTNEILPNRAKRKNGEGRAPRKKVIKAAPRRVGAMSILDRVGRYSKIDENVCDSYDLATAAKIATVARYMVMTEDPINRIEDFALSH